MGLFMEAAVIPDSTEEEVRAALSALESRNGQNGMQLERRVKSRDRMAA